MMVVPVGCGSEADETSSTPDAAGAAVGIDLPEVDRSLSDRDAIAQIMGLPDLMQLSYEFVGGTDDGVAIRYETWTYFDLLTAYEFADGQLVLMLAIEDPVRPLLVVPHLDPRSLDRAQDWDAVHALVGSPEQVVSTDLAEAYGESLVTYASPQFLAVFDADGLVYAETLPLEAP
jgi:hypothetical protein